METISPLQYSLHPRALAIRGILSIVFGILIFAMPGPSLLAIALVYAVYAFADGILAIVSGIKRGRHHESWGFPIFEGVLGVAAGVITLLWPGITLYVLSILIGIWAVSTGVIELSAAFQLHQFLPKASRGGRILLGLAGLISIVLGATIFAVPALGLVTLLTFVAGYSLVFGALMIGLAVNVHKEEKSKPEIPVTKAA